MTREKADLALKWFERLAAQAPMPGAREMYGLAAEALREYVEREKKPLTNADRIRAMSNDDLFAVIGNLVDYSGDCRHCPAKGFCDGCFHGKSCGEILILWLQQPAEGGDRDEAD